MPKTRDEKVIVINTGPIIALAAALALAGGRGGR
jgi:hypothetical protein